MLKELDRAVLTVGLPKTPLSTSTATTSSRGSASSAALASEFNRPAPCVLQSLEQHARSLLIGHALGRKPPVTKC
jgi:hypothetical protein